MYFKIKSEAQKAFKNAIKQLDCDFDYEIKLDFPLNSELGDLASNVSFQLAKNLKKAPNLIAKEIVENIEVHEIFKKVEANGPYVNLFIDYDIFANQLLNSVDENYGVLDKVNEKIILEHTSANPNGPLHIGHIRNSILGDSLKRLLIAAGREVDVQYYVNDMGRQLAMIIFGMEEFGLKLEDQASEKIDHKIGELYFKINQILKEDESLNEGVSAIIKKYDGGPSELDKKFEYIIKSCLEGIKETLKRMNITHDAFIWEGQFVRTGIVDKITQELTDIGYARKEDVLYLDLTEYGIDKHLVLRRTDGTSLYSTRDIAYHIYKCKKCDKVLDIFGSDHKLAAKQVSLALEILEVIEPDDDKVEVIFYEFINLPEGSMSTRKGVFISVDELIDEAVKRAKKEIILRRPELDAITVNEIAEKIGIGSIRYYIAKLSPEKPIIFKWDDALSFERGCVSIQYAHARACKLLKKAKKKGININLIKAEENWLLNENEKELLKLIAKFPNLIENSANIKRVHPIAQYCQDLASAFNRFYKSEQVIESDVENARLILVEKTKITLKNALNILGISAPEHM